MCLKRVGANYNPLWFTNISLSFSPFYLSKRFKDFKLTNFVWYSHISLGCFVVKWFYYLKWSLALMLALKCSNDQLLWYVIQVGKRSWSWVCRDAKLNWILWWQQVCRFVFSSWIPCKFLKGTKILYVLILSLPLFDWVNLIIHSPYLVVAKRAQFTGMLMNSGPNLVDPRGRLLPRSYDVLGDAFTLHYLLRSLPLYHLSLATSPFSSLLMGSFGVSLLQVFIPLLYFKSQIQMLHPQ